MKKAPLEFLVLAYVAGWIPYIAITRVLSTRPHGGMTRPLTGVEMLPLSMIVVSLSMYAFLWIGGWWRSAHRKRIGSMEFPIPTVWTALAGFGAMLILVTVPLSFTFPGVSIPFIQLLMRGDALIVAPLVDVLAGRKVHWYSRGALILVAIALAVTIRQRGGLHVPLLCLLVIALNACGYFLRLIIMTRLAKTSDPTARKRYFVEEQLVAYPLTLTVLGGLAWIGGSAPLAELHWGFTELWRQSIAWLIVPPAVLVMILGVVAALILLDERENTFCVPLERSASVVGGMIAAILLAKFKGYPAPTPAELLGVGLLIAAIVLLSVGPKFGRREGPKQSQEDPQRISARA